MAVSVNLPGSIKVLNPFPLDYWKGPWASVAAAKAGVPLGARFDGLTVKINALGEYWWLAADLTDTGLVPKTVDNEEQAQNLVFAGPASGANALPTFRSLVLNDIPSLSSLYLPISGGTLTGNLILNADPVTGLGAATKNYVDAIATALSWKNAVDVATTANITLSGEQTIDGVLTSTSDVLVWNQTDQTENGIYTSAAGAWSRRADSNTGVEIVGSAVAVLSGTLYNNTRFVYVGAASITIGVDDINYTVFDTGTVYVPGTGLTLTGNSFSITPNGVTNSLLRQGAAVSVIGRSANSTGDVADIAAASNNQILRRSGDVLAFGSIDISQSATVGSSVLGIPNGGTGLIALGTAGQLIQVNAGATALEYFTPNYQSTLAFSNGLTESGGTVVVGGLLTENTLLQDDVLATDRYFNIKLGDRAGFTLPYAELLMSYDGSGNTRSISLEVGNTAQDNISYITVGASLQFYSDGNIDFNTLTQFNSTVYANADFVVKGVTIGSPEPVRGFSVKNNASGGADANLGSAIGFSANRVFYDSYAEIIHTTDGVYGDGGGYHGTFIFNDMGSLYSGFPIPGVIYAEFGINGYLIQHYGYSTTGTSKIQSVTSGSNHALLTIDSGENTFTKTGDIQLNSYGGTIVVTATDGTDVSVFTVTKNDIKLLPNSGAPTVGYVWTASGTDGSGGWAAPSGGGWPLTGTGVLTGSVVIEGDGGGSYSVSIGGSGTEINNFSISTLTGFNIGTVSGSSISGGASTNLYLSATGTLRLGDGSGPFIELDGSTGLFSHSGTGANAGLSFPKGSFVNTTNQLTLGTTRTVTITAPTPDTTSRTWTIPDLSGDMTFVSLTGTQALTNKSINGVTLTTGGGTTNFLRADGTYAAPPGGGGITNSAVSTEIMVSNGTNAVGTKLYSVSNGDLTLGDTGLTGADRTISATGSATDVGIIFSVKAAGLFTFRSGSPFDNYFQISPDQAYLKSYKGSSAAPASFTIEAATGLVSATTGQNVLISGGGGYASGNTQAGSVSLKSGLPNGSGDEGSVNIQTRATGKVSFFNVTPVVKQSAVTTVQGLADALTAYGLIPASTISGGGGGIGGSTGATDNSVLRADGTGGATLQNSAVFIDDSANITLGTVSLAGSRQISVASSTADANLTILSQGSGIVKINNNVDFRLATASAAFVDTYTLIGLGALTMRAIGALTIGGTGSTSGTPPDVSVTGNQAGGTATVGGAVKIRGGISAVTAIKGGDVNIIGGDASMGNADSGDVYISSPYNFGTGKKGNLGISTLSVADWQDMELGVYLGNRVTAPTTGIANGVALYAEDVNSSSEFYVTTESGAKVNISGLLDPVTESGTSFTLNETHRNKIVLCTNSGVVTVTVGTGKAAGWNCMLVATHATGTITLSASGTTVNGTTVTTTQFETLSILHYGSENYLSKLG